MPEQDRIDALEKRIKALEDQVGDFLAQIKAWKKVAYALVALIGGTGVLGGVFHKFVWKGITDAVTDEFESRVAQNVNPDVTSKVEDQIITTLKSDPAFLNQLSHESAVAPVVKPLNTGAGNGTNPTAQNATSRTRIQLQIKTLSQQLDREEQPANFTYDAQTMINNVGLLLNCATVFIDEMNSSPSAFSYKHSDAPHIYDQISGLSKRLQGHIREFDRISDASGKKQHSETWFDDQQNGFNTKLQNLRNEHYSVDVFSDGTLPEMKDSFLGLRKNFYDAPRVQWPLPK